mmetsp:Transcript_16320/g.31670  ORF Transcript_16320/g.31670 Transcript_16320/m.31670 type:complete len:392 (+) Transcript_16320:136-1311(+)|eukprot:CAMPEP_0171519900 /NCGR_PEP_ID=MMETSP0959-20130129/6180_1 /TAXON_ID=87120 /ORGANISM="Aurantiochytrium limacinum, Strain ATCCMYA-1381" /LENGTH=391 /DNA_ID=CAMNT_0012059435 /DNA_START=60 /DNA_END=1235 /DNA_ORIENTATION=-
MSSFFSSQASEVTEGFLHVAHTSLQDEDGERGNNESRGDLVSAGNEGNGKRKSKVSRPDNYRKSEADALRALFARHVQKGKPEAPSRQLVGSYSGVIYREHPLGKRVYDGSTGSRFTYEREDVVRFVCVSDMHGKYASMEDAVLPEGDVLVNCGDLTLNGSMRELRAFREWMEKQPHKNKVVIAGNHDVTLDREFYGKNEKIFARSLSPTETVDDAISFVEEGEYTYLNGTEVEVEGLKIYGSPVTPRFSNWAFQMDPNEEIYEHWQKIPEDTDILLTHGPAAGFGDRCFRGSRAGCPNLLYEMKTRVMPLAHVFGHIHEDFGVWDDGESLYVNASTCSLRYRCEQPIIVFDVPRPGSDSYNKVKAAKQHKLDMLRSLDDSFAKRLSCRTS